MGVPSWSEWRFSAEDASKDAYENESVEGEGRETCNHEADLFLHTRFPFCPVLLQTDGAAKRHCM